MFLQGLTCGVDLVDVFGHLGLVRVVAAVISSPASVPVSSSDVQALPVVLRSLPACSSRDAA
ncbi:hypothetical protein GCM10009647_087810 [Streptomyces sanglieri]